MPIYFGFLQYFSFLSDIQSFSYLNGFIKIYFSSTHPLKTPYTYYKFATANQ